MRSVVKPVRSLLAVALLAIIPLTAAGSAAVPAPATTSVAVPVAIPVAMPVPVAVPEPVSPSEADQAPDPDAPPPAPNGDAAAEIGSVSEVAQNAASGSTSSGPAARPTVARSASPAVKSAAIWEARGRPDRLIIVRSSSIDSVAGGRLVRHVKRPVSRIRLSSLAAYVPSTWLAVDGSTARLSAALVLSTGVTLDASAPIGTLVLTGGAAPAAAATVVTGGGTLLLRGVTVSSADAATGAPMPVGPGRPYILVSGEGRTDVVDAVLRDLGATVGPKTYAGLSFDAGSRGSVLRTTLTGGTVGLRLDQSDGVLLQTVTVSKSATDGLMLTGDTGSVLRGITAADNGKNGVIVSGRSSPRPITDITTHGNHDFGVVVAGQSAPQISEIVTADDGAGGMEINHSTDVAVDGFTATDEPTGIYTHVSSARVVLQRLNVTGGRRGVVVEKTTLGLRVTGATVTGTELGVSLGGRQMRLTDVSVIDSQTAATVERGAADVVMDRLTISGAKNGVIANPGTTGVVIRDLTADGVANTAVRALSPDAQILGGRIDGSVTGIDVQAPTTLSDVMIIGADTGVRARTPQSVRAEQLDVVAVDVGINIAVGTPLLLSGSRVHALESIRGTVQQQGPNDLSLPALSLLGAIGVPLVLLAVVLEAVAILRHRRWARTRSESPGPADPPVSTRRTVAAAR